MGTSSLGLGMGGMATPTFNPAARSIAPTTAPAQRLGNAIHNAACAAQLPGPVKSIFQMEIEMEAIRSGIGFFSHISVNFKQSSSGSESLGLINPHAWQAQQIAS